MNGANLSAVPILILIVIVIGIRSIKEITITSTSTIRNIDPCTSNALTNAPRIRVFRFWFLTLTRYLW